MWVSLLLIPVLLSALSLSHALAFEPVPRPTHASQQDRDYRAAFQNGISALALFAVFKEDTSDLADPRYPISHRSFTGRLRQALAGHPDFRMARTNQGQMVYRRELF